VLTRREFDPAHDAEFFSALPAGMAAFVLRANTPGGEPYVSKTANLRRRLQRLLSAPDARPSKPITGSLGTPAQARRLNLRERVSAVEFLEVGGDFEAGFALYRLLRSEFPQSYATRLHLRPAPLLHMLRENPYPRVAVTSRLRSLRSAGDYFGPFASRTEAEQYANDSLDFFLLRRCTPELNPDPAFPGCVYSEMKMCLAPCFKGCTDERYAQEAASVGRYLESEGRSLLVELGRTRDEASARLEFEAAAAAHARLEKLKSLQARLSEIVHPIDRLNGVLLQPSHLAGHISLFRVAAGMLAGPIAFDVAPPPQHANSRRAGGPAQTQSSQSHSMEARIKDALGAARPPTPASAQELMEHLAILKRWYYRSNKVGEIFFEDEHGTLPMRRVVRAVGRVFKGEKPAGDLSETAGDYWAFRGQEAGLHPSAPTAGTPGTPGSPEIPRK